MNFVQLCVFLGKNPAVNEPLSPCRPVHTIRHETFIAGKSKSCSVLITYSQHTVTQSCLQCFDAVGWVAGRASGL